MGNVVKLFDNSVPNTGMSMLTRVHYTNATGTIVYILCEDSTGQTMAFYGVKNPSMSDKDNDINVAKFGSKVSKRDADYHFGTQENYKYD